MSKLTDYRVVRPHDGDRFYNDGDTRTARAEDVKHLVPHVLEEIGPSAFGGNGDHAVESAQPAEKAEQPPLNKAVPAAPANKAVRSRKSKRA
jgi:hypothetical protein